MDRNRAGLPELFEILSTPGREAGARAQKARRRKKMMSAEIAMVGVGDQLRSSGRVTVTHAPPASPLATVTRPLWVTTIF